jgi:membrane protease YdiL (CAAX protease family)
MNYNKLIENHSILQSIVLSLAPGLFLLLFFIIFAPVASRYSLPSILVLFIAIPLVLVPFEIGYLFFLGRILNGHFSLKGIVLFKEHIPIWQFFLFVPILLIWAAFCFVIIAAKIDSFFINYFFSWLPSWFFIEGFIRNMHQYSKAVLLITIILGFVFNGFIGPIVEELYFRGYLLPS